MQSILKKLYILLMLCCFFSASNVFANFVFDSFLPQAVIYPMKGQQPLVGVRVTSLDWNGGKLWHVYFELSENTPIEKLRNFKVYSSSGAGFGTDATELNAVPLVQNGRRFTLDMPSSTGPILSAGNSLFLTAEVSPLATSEMRFSGQCVGINIDGGNVTLHPSKGGSARVYNHAYRIIPYYRFEWIMGWGNWTDDYMDLVTDIIYFHVSADGDGKLTGQMTQKWIDGFEKLKAAKVKSGKDVQLLLGMAHCDGVMAGIVSDPAKRTRLADQLVDLAIEKGFNGIDIDWEYPDNLTEWGNYGTFLFELKSKAYVHGLTISCAISPYGNSTQPPATVINLFDYVNFMSYDAPGRHSTMETMINDINWARGSGKLPNHKIVSGLPFYSNETKSPRNWDNQQGYSGIISNHPDLTDDDNLFTHSDGNEHYFNGVTLLKQKGARIKSEKIGGGMIWCYDGDLPLSNVRSAARHLSQELIQSPHYVYVKPALGVDQVIQNGLTWETAFVGDQGVRSALTQNVSMVRIASGNYSFTSSLIVPANQYICGGYKEGQEESAPLGEAQTVFMPTVTGGNAIKLEMGSVFDCIEINGSGITTSARAIETSSNVTIDRSYIHGIRTNVQTGAAIYINGANSILKRSRIEDNQSSSTINDGGIVYLGAFKVDIDACYFIDNVYTGASGSGVWARGGCIYSSGGSASNFSITNSLFKNNRLNSVGEGAHGGAIGFQSEATPNRVINCTFIGNYAQSVSCIFKSNVLQNCVFYNNSASLIEFGQNGERAYNALAGSLGTASIDITGKTEVDLFTNAAINDYTPAVGSVLLNVGTNGIWKKENKDILGANRLNGVVDIGAFESQLLTLTNLSGTGSGIYNAGDMVTISTEIPAEKMIVQWIITGSDIVLAAKTPLTFAMPDESITVEAQYRWIKGDTEDNPVLITNETELKTTHYQVDRYCKIANDFSLSAAYLAPLFKGHIDGDQKVITLPVGVTINTSLFGAPTDNPKIKNIVYKVDGTIQQDGSAGAFLKEGDNGRNAEIKSCTLILNGAIKGTANTGGFVGDVCDDANFKVYESTLYLRGTIATSSSADGHGSGGIFGKLNSNGGKSCVKNCNIVIYGTGKITSGGGGAQVGDLIGRYNRGDHANNIVAKENSITIGDKGNASRFKFNLSKTLIKWDAGFNTIVSGVPPSGALENNLFDYSGTILKSNTSSPIGSNDVSIVYTPTTADGFLAPSFKINYQVNVQPFTPIFTPTTHIVYKTGALYNSKLLASPVGADGMEIAGTWDWNLDMNEAVSGNKLATFTPATNDYNMVSQTIGVEVVAKPYLKIFSTKTQVEAFESYELVISAIISASDVLEVKYTKDGVAQTATLLSNMTEVRIPQVGASSPTGTITYYELIANESLYEIDKTAHLFNVKIDADVPLTDTRYITQSGAGDKKGRNWQNAAPKENLQELLNASDVKAVYLGAGTYISSIGSGTQGTIVSAFNLPENKTLIGGFPLNGGEAWSVANETLLNRKSTSLLSRILYMASGSTLKGVTISGGDVSIGLGRVYGCGIFAEENSKIQSCIVKNNRGSASSSSWGEFLLQGGGIYANGTITLQNVTINNNELIVNSSVGGYSEVFGAGLFCKSNATIENCQIISNSLSSTISGNAYDERSFAFGGGIYLYSGNATIVNTILKGNQCKTVLNGNTANASSFSQGGATYVAQNANVAILNTIMTLSNIQSIGGTNHIVKAQGGGLYINGKANILRSSILQNSSNKEGGGVYDNVEQAELKNSMIWKNVASTYAQTNITSNRLIHSAIQASDDNLASHFMEGSKGSFYLHSRNEHQFGPRLKKINSDEVALTDEEIDLRCLLGEHSVLFNRGIRETK